MITDTSLLLKVIQDMKSRGARVLLQAALLNHTIGKWRIVERATAVIKAQS